MNIFDIIQVIWISTAVLSAVIWLACNKPAVFFDRLETTPGNFQAQDIIIVMAVFMLALSIAGSFIKDQSSLLAKSVILSISNLTMAGIMIPLLNHRLEGGIKSLFPNRANIIKHFWLAGSYSFVAYGIAALIFMATVWVCSVFGYDKVQQHDLLRQLLENTSDKPSIIALYFSAAVTAPIAEELIFRGILLNTITKYLNQKWLGVSLVSILFAFSHAAMQHMPALFFLGFFFGCSMLKHKTILIPILMHAIFNAINISLALISN